MEKRMVFRKGTETDISAFLVFFRTSLPVLFPHYSPHSIGFTIDIDYGPEWLTKELKKGNKEIFLAFEDGEIVGYILVAKSVAGVSFADWLAVEKQNQKKGVATRLLALWEKEALKEGAHALQLWTSLNNVDFYKKRGFECGGIFPKAWHGEDCYLIYRTLREPEEKNFLKTYLERIKKA